MQKLRLSLLFFLILSLNTSVTKAAEFPLILNCKTMLDVSHSFERMQKEDPMRIWESSQRTPFAFIASIDFRIKEIKKSEGLYTALIEKLQNKIELTKEDLTRIVNLESDPILNLIEDEYYATQNFEKFILPDYSEETKKLYSKTIVEFKSHALRIIDQQRKLRNLLKPSNLSLAQTKLLIESWMQVKSLDSKNTNRMLDALTGTEENIEPHEIFNLHRSPFEDYRTHPLIIIKKITENLGLQENDIIIDLKAKTGRTLIAASILNPHLNFIGFEASSQKISGARITAQTHKLSNVQFISYDYLYSGENIELQKAKAVLAFEKLSEAAIEKITQIIKNPASGKNDKKYLILTKQEEINLLSKPNEFSIIEVIP